MSLKGVYITDLAAWCNIEFIYNDPDSCIYANPLYYAHKLYLNKELVTNITADMLQGVTEIKDYVFNECTSLESIALPDGVTYIGDYAFAYSAIRNITIPESVSSIGDYAFAGCSYLKSVIIPNGVTSIGDYMFYQCSCLESITIPESVASIGDYAFYNCTHLESIEIPAGVTSIGDRAFGECTYLKSITFKNTNGWKVSRNSDMLNAQPVTVTGDAATNATLLIYTYTHYYWHRYDN